MLTENQITEKIIGSAIEVHRTLGPGLLESAYQNCLEIELKSLNLNVKSEYHLPFFYKGTKVESGYRLDLFVEDKVIIELKSVEALNEIHFAQTMTYLKVTNCKVALLINFNVVYLKQGIRRIVNKL